MKRKTSQLLKDAVGQKSLPAFAVSDPKIASWLRTPSTSEADQQLERLCKWIGNARQVRVKVSGYTLQTTYELLGRVFEKLKARGPLPKIHLSILRPDLSRPLTIWNPNSETDRRYWDAVREAFHQGQLVRERVHHTYPAVTFDDRVSAVDPCIKSIIVNDQYALFGLYVLRMNRKEEDPSLIALDYVGNDTKLVELAMKDRSQRAAFRELLAWFDQMWAIAGQETASRQPAELFISYSHDDTSFMRAFNKHLSPLRRIAEVRDWTDERIGPFDDWLLKIKSAMERARVAVILISSSYLDSDFCRNVELKGLLNLHAQTGLKLVGVVVRQCAWDSLPDFSRYNLLPKDNKNRLKPVKSWYDPDEAWTQVVRAVHPLLVPAPLTTVNAL